MCVVAIRLGDSAVKIVFVILAVLLIFRNWIECSVVEMV